MVTAHGRRARMASMPGAVWAGLGRAGQLALAVPAGLPVRLPACLRGALPDDLLARASRTPGTPVWLAPVRGAARLDKADRRQL